MMDNGQMDFLDALEGHGDWLLSSIPEGGKNDCGVFVDNVLKFREGKLTRDNIEIKLCRSGDFIYFEYDYMVGTYGSGSPLCRPCHECHRANSAEFLAECIYNVFQHGVVPYDKNLVNYPKETKELLKLCKKACDRIAKEIARNAGGADANESAANTGSSTHEGSCRCAKIAQTDSRTR